MTAGSNVDLEASDEEEVPEAGKNAEPQEPVPAEPSAEPANNGEPPEEAMPERQRDVLGDSFLDSRLDSLDGGNGNLRAELTSADAMIIETDAAPELLVVEPNALDGIATEEAMDIEIDDEILQIGDMTDPWILPDYAEQDARMEKDFGVHDGEDHYRSDARGQVKKEQVKGFKRTSLYSMDWAGDKLLVTPKEGPGVRLLDVEKGEEERTWPGEWMSVRTDPNDPRIAAAIAWNGKFKIFDTRSSSSSVFDVDLKKTKPQMRDFLNLCWSPDSSHIALGNRSDSLYLLSLKTPKGDNCLKLGSYRNLNLEANQMAYTPNGDSLWVAAGGTPGKIHIFPSHTLYSEESVVAHNFTAISIAADPAGRYMCSGGADGLICVWEYQQKLCARCFLHPAQVITNVDFNHNGSLIAWSTGQGERSLTIMGSNTAIPYYQDLTPATVTLLRWHSSRNVLAYSLNASQLADDRQHRDRRGSSKDTPIIQLLKVPDDL